MEPRAAGDPLFELDLVGRGLEVVPEVVWEHTELRVLILGENALRELPERIGELTRLHTLDLGHNRLEDGLLGNGLGDWIHGARSVNGDLAGQGYGRRRRTGC